MYAITTTEADGSTALAGGPFETTEDAAEACNLYNGPADVVALAPLDGKGNPMIEVPEGKGVAVKYDGGSRFVSNEEVQKMAATDDPVEVR